MKKAILISLIVGVFFVLLALLLQSLQVRNDEKAKMQKVRDAKKAKAEQAKNDENLTEDGKEVLQASND